MKLKDYIKFIKITDFVCINGKNVGQDDTEDYEKLLDNEIKSLEIKYEHLMNSVTNKHEVGKVHHITTKGIKDNERNH